MLIFYLVALAIIVGGGILTFTLLRRLGILLASAASLGVITVLVLIWPIPIHGGFMFLGEAIYDEWSRNRDKLTQLDVNKSKQDFLQNQEHRFRGELPFKTLQAVSEGWVHVVYGQNQFAWLDTQSGQIWSDWLLLSPTESLPPLSTAKLRCSEHAPAGYWALPTEAEHVVMKRSGGYNILPQPLTASMSYIVDTALNMELPTYRVKAGSNISNTASRRFSVRCIARSPDAPEQGYFKQDISLVEWNRYQLSK